MRRLFGLGLAYFTITSPHGWLVPFLIAWNWVSRFTAPRPSTGPQHEQRSQQPARPAPEPRPEARPTPPRQWSKKHMAEIAQAKTLRQPAQVRLLISSYNVWQAHLEARKSAGRFEREFYRLLDSWNPNSFASVFKTDPEVKKLLTFKAERVAYLANLAVEAEKQTAREAVISKPERKPVRAESPREPVQENEEPEQDREQEA